MGGLCEIRQLLAIYFAINWTEMLHFYNTTCPLPVTGRVHIVMIGPAHPGLGLKALGLW